MKLDQAKILIEGGAKRQLIFGRDVDKENEGVFKPNN